MKPFFSIIIPHRGPQNLLDKCVASIPQRDDLETVVVIDKDGNGAGWARNEGLKKAQGKYVIFADSDDSFHSCFSDFLDTLSEDSADVVYFNADSVELDTGEPSWRANQLNRIINSEDKEWQERHLRYYFTEPWCRAIKRSFIEEHNISFSGSKILNDIFFTTQVGIKARTIAVYSDKCYCVGNHNHSTAKLKSGDIKMLEYTRETAKSNMLLRKYGVKHHHSRMLRPFFSAIFHMRFCLAMHCWQIMREAGFTTSELFYYTIRYPRDFIKLVFRKIQSGEI